jgi:hypothetical protein
VLNLFEIIKRLGRSYPEFSSRMAEASALSAWEQAVGTAIVKNTRALFIKEKKFYVEVPHPLWRAELTRRKTQILEKLNAHVWEGTHPQLEDLVFVDPGFLERGEKRRASFREKKARDQKVSDPQERKR